MKGFNSSKFAGIYEKVKQKRKELENIQLSIFLNGSNTGLLDQEKDLSKELHELMLVKEIIYRQKSSVQWLQKEDLNTKFFHSIVAVRKK